MGFQYLKQWVTESVTNSSHFFHTSNLEDLEVLELEQGAWTTEEGDCAVPCYKSEEVLALVECGSDSYLKMTFTADDLSYAKICARSMDEIMMSLLPPGMTGVCGSFVVAGKPKPSLLSIAPH